MAQLMPYVDQLAENIEEYEEFVNCFAELKELYEQYVSSQDCTLLFHNISKAV
jgi:hypothetical protein